MSARAPAVPALAVALAGLLTVTLAGWAPPAAGGIVFTPHAAEYDLLPRGSYADHTVVYSRIDEVYDRDGNRRPLGDTAIPPGSAIDAGLVLFRYLWVGNLFEHSGVPILAERDQLFRVIGNLGWQQAHGDIPGLSRQFGLTSGGSGLGDVFLLAGLYGKRHRFGPVEANGLFTTTVKLPVGEFDEHALLNTGTNYFSVIPQLSGHATVFGRLLLDGTVAMQFNGRNDEPAYGGLTPTRPADVFNVEGNVAWKFTNRVFADVGLGYYATQGSNEYDEVTINLFDQPVPATTACQALNVPTAQCALTDQFFLRPQPGTYRDAGIRRTLLTTSAYYVYRSSSVLSFRVAVPLSGRGGQIDVPFDVFAGDPDAGGQRISTLPARLTTVQEAASIPASPFYEVRFVYLFWAP